MAEAGFLSDLVPRPWTPDAKHGFLAAGLFVGQGSLQTAHGCENFRDGSNHEARPEDVLRHFSAWRHRR